MHRITAATRRGSLSLGRGIASLVVAAALTLPGTAFAQSPTPGTSPGGTTFASLHFPYTMELPPGWSVVGASQVPTSDEDQFIGDGLSARVGGGILEDPQQTVADRVAAGRAAEIADGCTSDPSMDRATTLGGAEAILWSWSCSDTDHVGINTIHDGVRLRLQVNVTADRIAEAEPLLEALRGTFQFTGDAAASPGPVDLGKVDAGLQGLWVNDWHPVELEVAALVANGLLDDEDEAGWRKAMGSAATAQQAIRFEDGEFTQYSALDDGPLEIGTIGTYRLLDDHTIEATETATLGTIQLAFTRRDDVLTMEVLTELDPADMIPLVGIFETLPFTRVA